MPTDVQPVTDVVLLAHGSPDPRHAEGVERVADRVRSLSGAYRVHPAYLAHHPPAPADVAARLAGGVLVPLLLTPAYHVRVDIPQAAAAMDAVGRGRFVVAPALGPDELLFRACEELLTAAEFSAERETAVVLFVGGSSDREAVSAVGAAAQARGRRGWGAWTVAALAGGDPIAEVVARLHDEHGATRVLAVSYTVSDGVLRDRMVEQSAAAGALLAPGTLSDTEALARLVMRRAGGSLPR